jgi:type IV secretory pathway protease TraF
MDASVVRRFSGMETLSLASIAVAILLSAGLGCLGLRFNRSPSLPGYFYREVSRPITVGGYVSFCLPWTTAQLPAAAHTTIPICTADHPEAALLLKRVTAIGADGRLTVRGTNPFSFDSRSYGPIPVSAVHAVLVRVW